MKVRTHKRRLTINPFVSEAQRRACYAADDPDWDCSEWDAHTPDKKLPKKKATHNIRLVQNMMRRKRVYLRNGRAITRNVSFFAECERDEHGWCGPGTGEKAAIHVGNNIKLAARMLATGKRVVLDQPDQLATLLDKMHGMVQEAVAKGKEAPKFDLCKVSVEGTNLFCQDNIGIPRVKMPQLKGMPQPGSEADKLPRSKSGKVDVGAMFVEHLKSQGIEVKQVDVRASHLRASQNEIDGAKIADLVSTRSIDKLREQPIFVTKDNYVVDGHHHWAAIVGKGAKKDKDYKMPVYRIDTDIGTAIHMANEYASKVGIKPKSTPSAKATTNAVKQKSNGKNILRYDPSRTLTMRRTFQKKVKRKFARLKAMIYKLVVVDDAFGLKGKPTMIRNEDRANLSFRVAEAVVQARKKAETGPDYQRLFINGGKVWWVSFDGDEQDQVDIIKRAISGVEGVTEVTVESEVSPKGEEWHEIDYRPEMIRNYSPDQPRDESGRFGEGGGGATTSSPGEGAGPQVAPGMSASSTKRAKMVREEADKIPMVEERVTGDRIRSNEYDKIEKLMTDEEKQWLKTEIDKEKDRLGDDLFDYNEGREDMLQRFYYNHNDEGRFTGRAGGKLDVWGRDKDGERAYNFNTSNGNSYRIYASEEPDARHPGIRSEYISFADSKGEFSVTGAGGAHEVFHKVSSAITAIMVKDDIDVATFTAEEPSRQKLYTRLVKTAAAAAPQYSAIQHEDDGGTMHYTLYKRDLKEKLKGLLPRETTPEVIVNVDEEKVPEKGIELTPEARPEWFTPEGWPEEEEKEEDKTDNAFCPTGPGGGIDSSCSPASSTKSERTHMLTSVKKTGGFTYIAGQHKYQQIGKEGFAVSPYPERSTILEGKIHRSQLTEFMTKNKDLLTKPDHAVGAWKDPATGKTYLDVSIVTKDKDHAISLGRQHNQIAIFDFKSGSTIDTGGTGQAHNYLRPGGDGRGAGQDSRRPQWRVLNAFCATGEGGGQDNSCSSVAGAYHGAAKLTQEQHDQAIGKVDTLSTKELQDTLEQMGQVHGHLRTKEKLAGKIKELITDRRGAAIRAKLVYRPGQTTDIKNALATNAPNQFKFLSTPEKMAEFQAWLKKQVGTTITGKSDEELWKAYAQAGFKKGAGRAFDDLRAVEKTLATTKPEFADGGLDFYEGGKDQMLRSAFGRPENVDKIKMLASRSYDDLKNVTEDMKTKIGRSLMDGLVEGKNPRAIAKDMMDDVDISYNRAEVIARTEIIRAHAEGQLSAFEMMNVAEVGVAVEWSTAGDDRVCDECEPMEGAVFKIEEAHNMIPRHPNCRCAFIPANVGEDDEDQKRSKDDLYGAIRESREAADQGADEWGPDKRLTKDRPESTVGIIKNYNPDQERDEHGRFGSGGGAPSPVGDAPIGMEKIKQTASKRPLVAFLNLYNVEMLPVHVETKTKPTAPPSRTHEDVDISKLSPTEVDKWSEVVGQSKASGISKSVKEGRRLLPILVEGGSVLDGHHRVAGTLQAGKSKIGVSHSLKSLVEIWKAANNNTAPTKELVAKYENHLRTAATHNAFCPTGPGGGVDPTCSPGTGGASLPTPGEFKLIGSAGGSTGAMIIEDKSGKRWIMKSAADGTDKADHIRNEDEADDAYRALGINVPKGGTTQHGDTINKFTEFIPDTKPLWEYEATESKENVAKVHEEIRKGFVADALLSNWDVVGQGKDNILIDKEGKVYRVDNGGALAYRAQGYPKGEAFGPNVEELQTLRDPVKNPQSASIFKDITQKEIDSQIKDIMSKKDTVMKALSTPETKDIVFERFNDLVNASSVPVHVPPSPPTPTPSPVTPAGPHPSTMHDLKSSTGLTSYIKGKEKEGGVKFTPLQLKKLEHLNPNGIVNGVFNTHVFTGDKAANTKKMDYLKKILPPGTVIKTKAITAAKIGYIKSGGGEIGKGIGGEPEPSKTPTSTKAVKYPPLPSNYAGLQPGHTYVNSQGVKKEVSSVQSEGTYVKIKYVGEHGEAVVPADKPFKFSVPTAAPPPAPKVEKVHTAEPTEAWSTEPVKGSDAHHYVVTHHESTIHSLTAGQKMSVQSYTGSGYIDLNAKMRECPPTFDCVKGSMKTKMNNIIAAIDKAPHFDKPVMLNRGLTLSGTKHDDYVQGMINSKDNGTEMHFPSITSTSTSTGFGGNIRFRIAAKGGLAVSSISSHPSEREVIISPKQKFKVIGVKSTANGKHYIDLEEL